MNKELPKKLLTAPLSAKIVWLYLRQYGTVSFSRRRLVEALGLSPVTLHQAFKYLEPYLSYQCHRIGMPFVYCLQGCETAEITLHPQPLPEAIRTATPSVKAVYLWNRQVDVCCDDQLEKALGISKKTAKRVQTLLAS